MSLTNSYCTQVQRDVLKSQLVDLVAQGKMDSVLVDSFDRMSVKIVLEFAKEMSEAGVPVEPQDQRRDRIEYCERNFQGNTDMCWNCAAPHVRGGTLHCWLQTELPITCAAVFFDPAPTPPPPPTYPKKYVRQILGAKMRRKAFVGFSLVLQELKTKFEVELRFSRVVQELKIVFELSPTRSRVPFQFHPHAIWDYVNPVFNLIHNA
jgi:hypothetical protein